MKLPLSSLLAVSLAACSAPEDLAFPIGPGVADAELEALPTNGGPVFWPYGIQGGGHPEGHRGWDFDAPEGAEIVAVGDGRVRRAGACGGGGTPCSFGSFVVIALDGSSGVVGYHHLGPLEVEDGDPVTRGQRIATFARYEDGNPVLHFDVAVGVDKRCPEDLMSGEALDEAERWLSHSRPNPEFEDPIYLDEQGRYSALCFD